MEFQTVTIKIIKIKEQKKQNKVTRKQKIMNKQRKSNQNILQLMMGKNNIELNTNQQHISKFFTKRKIHKRESLVWTLEGFKQKSNENRKLK